MNSQTRGIVGVVAVLAIILLLLLARGAEQRGVPQNSPTAGGAVTAAVAPGR
jgi:hypothetical protein